MHRSDTIDTVKAFIRYAERVPKVEQSLSCAGHATLIDEHTLTFYKIKAGTTLNLKYDIDGAGKRARASGGGNVNREDKLMELTMDCDSKILQLQSMPTSPTIAAILKNVQTLRNHLVTFPESCMQEMVSRLGVDALRRISDVMANSNNLDHKLMTVAKQLFSSDFANIGAQVSALKVSELAVMSLINNMYHAQYMSSTGGSDTKQFATDVTKALINQSRAAGAAATSAAGAAGAAGNGDVPM